MNPPRYYKHPRDPPLNTLRFVCFHFTNLPVVNTTSTQLKSKAVPSIDDHGRDALVSLRRWRHDFVQPQESIGKVFEMSQARKPSLNSHSYSVLIDNLKQIPDGCSGRARQPWNPNSSRGTSAIAMGGQRPVPQASIDAKREVKSLFEADPIDSSTASLRRGHAAKESIQTCIKPTTCTRVWHPWGT